MQEIILDFTNAKNWLDIYTVMKQEFSFPYEWGNNLDALYDAMSYTWRENVRIKIIGTDSIPNEWKKYMVQIFEVFQDIHNETPNVIFEIIS